MVEGARALVLALLAARDRRAVVLFLPDDAALDSFRRDLEALLLLAGGGARRVSVFPALDADPYGDIPPHPEVCRRRVTALGRLARGERPVLLAPARVLLETLPSPEEVRASSRVLRPGDAVTPDGFVLDALRGGYRRTDVVSAPGR
jgi:Transcription-repair coupling factor (superfamily II helicase)